jgi:hypothetical protein
MNEGMKSNNRRNIKIRENIENERQRERWRKMKDERKVTRREKKDKGSQTE